MIAHPLRHEAAASLLREYALSVLAFDRAASVDSSVIHHHSNLEVILERLLTGSPVTIPELLATYSAAVGPDAYDELAGASIDNALLQSA